MKFLLDNDTPSFSEVLDSICDCDLEYDDHWQQQSVNDFLHEFTIIALNVSVVRTTLT